MQTNKQKNFNNFEKQKNLSRLKRVKKIILEKGFYGVLNNQKWFAIFEIIEKNNISFKIKLVDVEREKYCEFIIELESTSLLINNFRNYIEFFEIEYIELHKNNEMLNFLNSKKTNYVENNNKIKILGYLE